jgi:nucleotide-binding universal stress UspA family protein
MANRASGTLRVIVLGTDLSVASEAPVARALAIAARTGAEVHVVHAAPRIPRALARRFSFGDDRQLRQALDDVIEPLRRADIRVRAHLMQGDAVKALTAKARAVAADIVIVGSRGRALPDVVLGSTAERLLALDQHRVLLARRDSSRPYAEVLIAANEDSDLRAQAEAAALFSRRPSKVLHAFEAPLESTLRLRGAISKELNGYRADAKREASERMTKQLKLAGIEPSQLVLRHGHAVALMQRVPLDTLLVLSRRHSTVSRLFLGSVTRAAVAHVRCDVLLV